MSNSLSFESKEAKANWLFSQNFNFVAGAANIESIPPATLPEVVFIGRSNVGKSSLINALTNRKTLVKVSSEPGRTQQINFFECPNSLRLVDVPGYGFAKSSKDERSNWQKLIKYYLQARVTLNRVFLLLDSRHEIKESDIEMMKFLDEIAVSYQLIFTKVDLTNAKNLEANKQAVRKIMLKHTALHPEFLIASSKEQWGIKELREIILEIMNL